MITRFATTLIHELAGQFPAVLILGARQCGKTTLARDTIRGHYFDLEKPADYQIFAGEIQLALSRFGGPLVIDEAQRIPELFSVLRALIDEKRAQTGRFFLLGSVNPSLVRHVSESLAGRVGTIELTPFLFPEVSGQGMDLGTMWLRGGFPDACLEEDTGRRVRWYENYVLTAVERDMAVYGLVASPFEMRRFMTMLAHVHGGLLNASELGRAMGVSYHTVQRYLDILEGHFLVRRLQPWFANIGKRLVKAPKAFIRDSGLCHYLLGIRGERELFESPRRGATWEGFMVEQVIALERLAHVGSQFWFFRTQAGVEIDLIVDRGDWRRGYEFKCASSVKREDAAGLLAGLVNGVIHAGSVVYFGDRRFPLADGIEAMPAAELLDPGMRR